jgi:TonB family protein
MQIVRRAAARPGLALAAVALLALLTQIAAPRAAAGWQQEWGRAPGPAILAGVVHDESGNEIASVEVTLEGTTLRSVTDPHGAFILRRVPLGRGSLRVRRLGFVPRTLEVEVDSSFAAPLEVVLTTLPIRLATVQVSARRRIYTGYAAEFYRRRDSGISGHFFTRAEIDSLKPYRTTDLLRRIPGVNFASRGGETVVSTRGQRCTPLVWIDGTPASAAYFDPDHVDPRSIEGIEVYSGLSTVPVALLGPRMAGNCGVIAIWTRIPDPRPRGTSDDGGKREPKVTASRLAALVDSLQVYTVAQVDEAVTLDTAVRFAPQFPDQLRKGRQAGLVIAEFVVDVEGRVEPATVGIVSSTHPLFTAAVDSALASAVFHPAMLAGRPVRQVVQLPVHFALPGKNGN